MLSYSLSLALVASITFATATTAQSMNNTGNQTEDEIKAYCYNVVDLYQSPNASNTYTIPAIIQPLTPSTNISTAPLTDNTILVWQVKNVVGQHDSIYNVWDRPQLYSSIYLNPLEDGPVPVPAPPALSTCSFLFNLPDSADGKDPDNGDCSSLLGKPCVKDIQSSVQELSQSIASSATMSLEQACNSLGQSLFTLPESCPKGTSSDKFSLIQMQGHNLTKDSNNTDCPNGPPELPVPLFRNYEPYQEGNFTIYDQWVKKTTPVLMAFFTNGTLFTGTPFVSTQLLCTSPKNISANSHIPTSAAGRSSTTDTKRLVGAALVMNALLFLTL